MWEGTHRRESEGWVKTKRGCGDVLGKPGKPCSGPWLAKSYAASCKVGGSVCVRGMALTTIAGDGGITGQRKFKRIVATDKGPEEEE